MLIQKNWLELIKPNKVEVEHKTEGRNYGKVVVEPLERGFGLTFWETLYVVFYCPLCKAQP